MKRTLLYSTVFALVIVALISGESASARSDDQVLNAGNNAVSPFTGWRIVKQTFQLGIHFKNSVLSQLIIDIPSNVGVSNDIDVFDDNGKKININVSVNGRRIIINFPKLAISTTQLVINFNKVKQPIIGPTSVYHLSAKVVGSDVELPIGVAQFPTSIDSSDNH